MISAGIHHLVLNQNRSVLRKDLKLESLMDGMFKEKYDIKQNVLSVEKREEQIQKFIDWLQWRPLQDYREFVNLLEDTQQISLADSVAASCKFM